MSVLLNEEEHHSTTKSVGVSSSGAGLVTEGRGGGKRSVIAEADVLFTATTGYNHYYLIF